MMKTATLLSFYQNNNHADQDDAPSKDLKFKKVASLDDRSELSEEMAELCKKQAIYQVVEAHFTDKVSDVNMEQAHARRKSVVNRYSLLPCPIRLQN